jgi:hypothetical protein
MSFVENVEVIKTPYKVETKLPNFRVSRSTWGKWDNSQIFRRERYPFLVRVRGHNPHEFSCGNITKPVQAIHLSTWHHHCSPKSITPLRIRPYAGRKIGLLQEWNTLVTICCSQRSQFTERQKIERRRIAAIPHPRVNPKRFTRSHFVENINRAKPHPRSLIQAGILDIQSIGLIGYSPQSIGNDRIPKQHQQSKNFDDESGNVQTIVVFIASLWLMVIGWWLVWYGWDWRWQALEGALAYIPFCLAALGYFQRLLYLTHDWGLYVFCH